MKANNYKLKQGITLNDLEDKGFRYSMRTAQGDYKKKTMFKYIQLIHDMELHFEIDIEPEIVFDDFDSLLVLDGNFCQPYTPFYGENYKKDITGFKSLENVIRKYNETMDSIGLFERY